MARLLHALATKTNEIPLTRWSFANLFRKKGDETIRREWYIEAKYAGEDEKKQSHSYRFVFDLKEAEELYAALGEMLPRLRGEPPTR